MKKLLIALLILGLVVIAVLGFSDSKLLSKAPETETPVSDAQEAPNAQTGENPLPAEEPAEEAGGVDYAAIYALHAPEEVVMTVDGRDVTWQDYFYGFYSQATNMEDQFQMYQYYGYALGWESQADEEGNTFAQLLTRMGEENLRRVLTAECFAEENGVTLNAEEEDALQAEHLDNIQYFCGENGTEEQLFAQLKERYLTEDFYWRVMRFGPLTQAARRCLYGEEGELLDEQEVLAWMEEQGLISANHILIATMDLNTGAQLDEDTLAEKTALAQQLAEELQAIEDPEEREARFLELKEQYCEDGGDYVFGPGVMVEEFYEGAKALEEGQVSDPIQTQYGYHIILRRPLHADDAVFTSSGTQSARSMMLDTVFSSRMQERMDQQVVEYAPGFEPPYILDYYTKPSYAS